MWSSQTHLLSASPTDQLARDTKLSQTEVDCWFSERRALRDNMEKALLNLGGVPRVSPPAEEEEEGPGPQVTGAPRDPEPLPPVLCSSSSSSSSSSPPVLVASSPHPLPVLSASVSPPLLAASSPPPSSSPRPPVLSASTSPAPIDSGSLTLLREVGVESCLPSYPTFSGGRFKQHCNCCCNYTL